MKKQTYSLKAIIRTTYSYVDLPMLLGLSILTVFGLVILFSAGDKNPQLLKHQLMHIALAFSTMIMLTQISPETYLKWAPVLFLATSLLLMAVLSLGIIGKGSQRWLAIGPIRFEPAELMKITVPLILSWYLHYQQLPLKTSKMLLVSCILLFPALLVAKEPDLGTAIILFMSGGFVLFLGGLSRRFIQYALMGIIALIPIGWHYMHGYQKERLLNFLYPEHAPLGGGYHIIQSKIAIGSGGLFGKGWFQGMQSHLKFLPEHTTDFIFAVCGEEFGLFGSALLIACIGFITYRGLYLSSQAQNTFSRLLATSLCLTFFLSAFVNIGMVCGLLPVVGLPLPLVSYGGTNMLTTMASFGILMSVLMHRRLVDH